MPRETTTRLQEPAGVFALPGLDLLDTPPEEGFDRLTRLASRTLDVPIALVNLIAGDRQFFKSAVGMGDVRELPVGTGVFSYALAAREPLVIEDARADPRFSSNTIVTEHGLVAYIGIPLVTSGGHALGTFCVVDLEPRAWREGDVETMRDLAGSVLTEVDLRVAARELERNAGEAATARAAAEAAHRSMRELVEGLDAIVWEADAATWRFSFVSRRAEEVLGYPVGRWLEDPEFWRTWMHAEDQERVAASCRAAIDAGRDHEVEYRAIAADGRTVWICNSVRILSDEQGHSRRLRGVMTDVSARRAAESALEESEARYRSLAEDALGTSEVGTFILDSDFRVAWTNQAIERFFGLERGEAIGTDKRRLIRGTGSPLRSRTATTSRSACSGPTTTTRASRSSSAGFARERGVPSGGSPSGAAPFAAASTRAGGSSTTTTSPRGTARRVTARGWHRSWSRPTTPSSASVSTAPSRAGTRRRKRCSATARRR